MLQSISKNKKIFFGILYPVILISIIIISYFTFLTPTYKVTICPDSGPSACSKQQTVTIIRGTEDIKPVFEVGYDCPDATYPVFEGNAKFIGCTYDKAFKQQRCNTTRGFDCLNGN